MISIKHFKKPELVGLDHFLSILKANGCNPTSAVYADVYSRLLEIPTNSGCYIVFDPEGNALYIGKAVNLRRRILSHIVRINGERRWICAGYRMFTGPYAPAGSIVMALSCNGVTMSDLECELVTRLKPSRNTNMNGKKHNRSKVFKPYRL